MVSLLWSQMYSVQIKKSIQQVYTTHKFIVSCDNRWACHFYLLFLLAVKTGHVRSGVYTFASGEECYSTVIKPFDGPQFYAIIVCGPQFYITSTPFFHYLVSRHFAVWNLFARTVPKHAIHCSWSVFTRSKPVYQLSKYSLCHLCLGICCSNVSTIFPEAFKSGWLGQTPTAPVWTSKLWISPSIPDKT